MNLKTALDIIPEDADSAGKTWAVEDALEFFIFGTATKSAWPKGQQCE